MIWARFRIKPEHVDDVLAMLREAAIEPAAVYRRDDGAVAIEVADVSEAQGQKVAASFRPEWSAIIGFTGGVPPLEGH
ncbi:hypothetical protein [Sphingomonas beigongshangi]|jgi:hypothetical protein|uniref:hypothetical protein n=1 Tax=Sphingomonas beigongshangi TaxID=2782540 RepID=UPI001AEE465F|nr:hypothetical protein [Sphingomonas beigongshangi]